MTSPKLAGACQAHQSFSQARVNHQQATKKATAMAI
jgi:hypothetical protein